MKKQKRLIMILVLLLAVGFAAVSTTLLINGNAFIRTNDFDVYFSSASIDGVEDNALISQDGKSITYETANLQVAGDVSKLDYTITNNSSQYDAEVKIECDFTGNEYVTLENTLQNEIIEAKTEKSGTLTATLIKTSTEERSQNFTCTIVANAIERTVTGSDTLIDGEVNTYSLYGYLVDENDNPLINETVVVYSTPQYTITDEEGYIYLEGIEKGSHTLYVMGETSIEEIQELSEKEVEEQAVTSARITTSTINIVFPNGYKIAAGEVTKTKELIVTFDGNGVDLENSTIQVKKGLAYGELPVLEREDYIFKGWYTELSDGTEVTSSTKVRNGNDHTLYARWKSIITCNGDICWTDFDKTETKTLGDLITIGNEGFHVMSVDDNSMTMISRYNLYVGGYYDADTTLYTEYGSEATGIQDSTMLGLEKDKSIRNGTTVFSSDTVHGTDYNTYEGSIVEGYVNSYSNYLKTEYSIANTATLITALELEDLGCDISASTCIGAPSWIYTTSYWTRTPRDTTYIYRISSTGFYSSNGVYNGGNFNGVRPVVTVSNSII